MLKHVRIALLTLTLVGGANAAIVGNGPPNQSGASDMDGFLLADRFTLSTASFLTAISYWTLQDTLADYSGTTLIDIFADAGATPGALIASGISPFTPVATGLTPLGFTEFRYTTAVSSALLAAGNYWLGLHNGPTPTIPPGNYLWEWAADTGISVSRDLTQNNPPWVGNFAALAFEITTRPNVQVPEPDSIALIGLGLVAAFVARRRRVPQA